MRHKVDELSIAAIDGAEHALTELSGVFDDRFEHWLRIEGRPADDVKHFRSGGLLRQRFAQLVEQASILNGDQRLIGKGGHQLDLFRCKRLRHLFCYEDHSDYVPLVQQRGTERGAIAAYLLRSAPGVIRVR